MKSLSYLLDKNNLWAKERREQDPDFFKRLADQQSPKYLWIGCADSRVPANQITGLNPGEIFVHRNVANLVIQTDFNMLSVVQFAVDVLKVEHIIVCGHYGCGGVKSALKSERHGLIDNWLRHIEAIARRRADELEAVAPEMRFDKLCEMNVVAQAENVSRTTIVQDAWRRGQKLEVHSWIYRLTDGLIVSLEDPITGEELS